jgi:hypothetical protein
VLLALSIGTFEVTRLRLAGDAASYRYGLSKPRECCGEGFWGVNRVVDELPGIFDTRLEPLKPDLWPVSGCHCGPGRVRIFVRGHTSTVLINSNLDVDTNDILSRRIKRIPLI